MKNTTTITIRNKSTVTSFGVHTHGNCKPIIAIDIDKTFNSGLDAARYFGCAPETIYAVLRGDQPHLRMYERDENKKRIRFLGTCRLTYVSHAEETVDALMENGRNLRDKLSKANEKLAAQESEMAEFRAWKVEQEKIRKAKEMHQLLIDKANARLERAKRMEQNAYEHYQLMASKRIAAEEKLAALQANA